MLYFNSMSSWLDGVCAESEKKLYGQISTMHRQRSSRKKNQALAMCLTVSIDISLAKIMFWKLIHQPLPLAANKQYYTQIADAVSRYFLLTPTASQVLYNVL